MVQHIKTFGIQVRWPEFSSGNPWKKERINSPKLPSDLRTCFGTHMNTHAGTRSHKHMHTHAPHGIFLVRRYLLTAYPKPFSPQPVSAPNSCAKALTYKR